VFLNSRGGSTTGVGYGALANNLGARANAVGLNALGGLPGNTGSYNNAFGASALIVNTTGDSNNAFGDSALGTNLTGAQNTAIGDLTLANTSGGTNNTALGSHAGGNLSSGSGNTFLGADAGLGVTAGSNNIAIGHVGTSTDSGVIRIGTASSQTTFFAAGIRGVTTGANNAIPVVIDANGQLGTVSSSRRFKEDIRDMGDASRALFNLRPVTFRYAKAYDDGAKPIQYGLVAEEVAEVFPDLAVKNAEGGVDTVHYETLSVLLLNELQKQRSEMHAQQQRIDALERRLEAMTHRPE